MLKNNLIERDGYHSMILRRRKGDDFETKIDKEGIEKIKDHNYSWFANYNLKTDSYYVKSTIYEGMIDGKPKYKIVYLHRVLMDAGDGEYVDHINHDTLDNRYCNLRILDNSENSMHRKGINTNNSTGYRNVSFDKSDGLYIVQLQIEGKRTLIGKFENLEDAAKCAKEARDRHYQILK